MPQAPGAPDSALVTYSSACQRVIMLMRLPTLALPATAPTAGSANQRTSLEIASCLEMGVGVERYDDRRRARACLRPELSAAALPPLAMVKSLTRGSVCRNAHTTCSRCHRSSRRR